MSLAKDFETIESLEYIVQFSVLSGFSSLQRAFAQDTTLESLRSRLSSQTDASNLVSQRISQVLTKPDVELYDESIAAYLFCLSHANRELAIKASEEILQIGGLWWSVQLALRIVKEAQTELA